MPPTREVGASEPGVRSAACIIGARGTVCVTRLDLNPFRRSRGYPGAPREARKRSRGLIGEIPCPTQIAGSRRLKLDASRSRPDEIERKNRSDPASFSQPMSREEVDSRNSAELGYERSEAASGRHYRTRQRHRHPKPKTLRCLPSPPSVSPPSAPPCASRAAPPSPRCVSRGAPFEDFSHARILSRCHASGRARNAPTTGGPSATNTGECGEHSNTRTWHRVRRRGGVFAACGGRGTPFP